MQSKIQCPCVKHNCRYAADDKNNNTCKKCVARSAYVSAMDGDRQAIEYLSRLEPGMLGGGDDCAADAIPTKNMEDTEGTEDLDFPAPGKEAIALPAVVKEYRPSKIVKKERSRRRYETKYYQSAAIIAKARYKKDFDTFGEILEYSYKKEKLQSKCAEIYQISKGTIQYLFSAYNIKTVGGMSAAMREKWRRRKAEEKKEI